MKVDFYTLERKAQDRFADSTRSIGVPTPIVRQPPAGRAVVLWSVGAAFIFASLVWWVLRGFGSLESATAIAPLWFMVGYAVLAAVVVFCLLRLGAEKTVEESLPYQPGLYLFPAGVFDARSDPLRVVRH